MTSCGADNNIICPQQWSDGRYNFDYITDQPLIIQLEPQMGMSEPHPEEHTVWGKMYGDMADALDHADVITDD